MSEKFFKCEFISPEERNLHQLKGKNLKEVIEYLEGREEGESQSEAGKKEWEEYPNREDQSIFDGFLGLLREKGVRVSTPEWLQFLQVIGQKTSAEDLKEMVGTDQLLNKIRLFAQTTLVKDKADESAFHEAFDEYFELAAKVYSRELQEEEKEDDSQDSRDSGTEPEMKEHLGIDEVDENLDLSESKEHDDDEQKHGGKEDQHNDILKKEDLAKKGGGDKKDGETGEGDEGKPSEGKGKEGEAGHGEGEKGEAGKGKGDKGEAGAGKGDKGEPSGMGQGGKESVENKNETGLPPEFVEAEQKE